MKVTLNYNPPVPVTPVLTGATIELTAEEVRLLSLNNWCGPKGHNSSIASPMAPDGTIANWTANVNDGVALRNLLRSIAEQLKLKG